MDLPRYAGSAVDAATAAYFVRAATGRPCAPATIRCWAFRGRLTRVGRRGRCTLYDLDELEALVCAGPVDEAA